MGAVFLKYMTKRAVKKKIDYIINELLEQGLEYLRPWGVLGLGFMPGNSVLMFLFGSQISDEMGQYRVSYNNQFGIILDYATELAEQDDPPDFEKYRDDVLEWDYFYKNYEGPVSKKEEFANDLVERNEKIARDLAPLVESDKDDFWEAAKECYTRDEIVGKIDYALNYSDMLKEYQDDIDVRTPPILFFLRLRYTDEVMRALDKSQRDLIDSMTETADEVFAEE